MESEGERTVIALNKAVDILRRGEVALNKVRYDAVIYAAHMAAEQAVGALLAFLGVENWEVQRLLPSLENARGATSVAGDLRMSLEGIDTELRELAEQRARVTHGLPGEIDAEDLSNEAPLALERARRVVEVCREAWRLLSVR